MHPKYSPIEVTRQFLAAFAYQDKESLDALFIPDVEFNLNCHDKVISGASSQEVSELLMKERSRWVQSRMDVKSWKNKGARITVKFHVQFGEDIFTDYLEYTADIFVQSNVISSLQMICSEKKRLDDLPVWEKPDLPIRNAASS